MTDKRRQLPKNQLPATLQGDHLDREVNRRRDRDYGGPNGRDYDREDSRDRRDYDRSDSRDRRDYDRSESRDRDYEDRKREYDERRRDPRDDRDRSYDSRDRSRDYDSRDRSRDYDDRDRSRDYDDRDRRDRRDYDDRRRDYDDRDRRSYDDRRDHDDRREHMERDPGFQPMESEPARERRPRPQLSSPRKVLVLVSSIVLLFLSFLFIGLGVVSIILRYYPEAAVPFVAGVACITHAVFGFYSRRATGKNSMTVVTSAVCVCCVIFWAAFGAFAYWAGQLLGQPGFQYQYRRQDLGYISVAGACLSVVAIIASMIVVWIGCGVTCCAEAPRHSYGQVKTEPKKLETEA